MKNFLFSNSATKVIYHFLIAFIAGKRGSGGRFGRAENNCDISGEGDESCQLLTRNCKVCKSCFMNFPRFTCKIRVNMNPKIQYL